MSRRSLLAGAGAATVAILGASPQPVPEALAFVGARVIDGNGARPFEQGIVLVRSGYVVAAGDARAVPIPAGARRVELAGKTIVPMLIDAHTHVGIVEGVDIAPDRYGPATIDANLATFLHYGIAAVLVMGTDRTAAGVRERLRNGDAPGAQMGTAGSGFGVAGGYPPAAVVGAPWIHRPTNVADAREAVRALSAQSPDIVKLWVDSGFGRYPTMDRSISAAIIDEAHRAGLRAAAHLFYLDDARALVEQGLDVVAHSVRDREIDDASLAEMRDRDVAYITTLALDESQFVYADDPQPSYTREPAFRAALETGVADRFASQEYKQKKQSDPATPKWRDAAKMSKHNALRVHRAGITVALGTDSGATFERIRGFDTHRELELLVASGLTPLEALKAGTVNAARVLGPRASELGALEPGKRANLLVLDEDPTVDITATRRIASIWQNGVRVASWREG